MIPKKYLCYPKLNVRFFLLGLCCHESIIWNNLHEFTSAMHICIQTCYSILTCIGACRLNVKYISLNIKLQGT